MIKPPQREREHSFNGRGRWFKVRVSVVEISMAEQALNCAPAPHLGAGGLTMTKLMSSR
jgi:hypothetical protein